MKMDGRQFVALAIAVALGVPGVALGQESDEPRKIRDNLFLLEEAYNQEPGVIQHIQVFRATEEGWEYSFTEEWPVPTDRHQLSVTVPMLHQRGVDRSAEIGDVLLNYRLQVLGMGGRGVVAMAPRVSAVLPTGDHTTSAGRGSLGVQVNLPASFDLAPMLVVHANLGLTFTPRAEPPAGGPREQTLDALAGIALVWLPFEWANAVVELAYQTEEGIDEPGESERTSVFIVNPGLRFAIDHASGLQIVPGASVPIEIEDGEARASVLGYLSAEHPLW